MAYTIEQEYSIARAAQRVQSAAYALTLTNNPSAALVAALNTAVADFNAIVNPVDPLVASVANGSVVNVVKSDGGSLGGGAASAAVSASTLNNVKLASLATIIITGSKITAPVTGTGTTGVTPTVVNGVVTGLVLS